MEAKATPQAQLENDGARAGILPRQVFRPRLHRSHSAGRALAPSTKQGMGARRRRRILNDHSLFRTAVGVGAGTLTSEDSAEWLKHSKLTLEYRSIFGDFVSKASPEDIKAFRDGVVVSDVVSGTDHRPGHNFLASVPDGPGWQRACDAFARVAPHMRECMQAEVSRMDASMPHSARGHMAAVPHGGGPGLQHSILTQLEQLILHWLDVGATPEPSSLPQPLAGALAAQPQVLATDAALAMFAPAPPLAAAPAPRRSKAARRRRAQAQLKQSGRSGGDLPALPTLPVGGAALPAASHGLVLCLASSQHRLLLHGLATYHSLASASVALEGWSGRLTLLTRKHLAQHPAEALPTAAEDAPDSSMPGDVQAPLPALVTFVQALLRGRAQHLARPVSPRRGRGKGHVRTRPQTSGVPLTSTGEAGAAAGQHARSAGSPSTAPHLPSDMRATLSAQGYSPAAVDRLSALWGRADSARRRTAVALAFGQEGAGCTMSGAREAAAATRDVGDVLFQALSSGSRGRTRPGSARRARSRGEGQPPPVVPSGDPSPSPLRQRGEDPLPRMSA